MTEAEWLESTDPQPMLRYLLGTDELRIQDVQAFPNCLGSDRKLRLFACACYHRIRHVLPHPRARAAVEVAERFADGSATAAELQRATASVWGRLNALEGRWRASRDAERVALHPTHAALALALQATRPEAPKAAYYASSNAYLDYAAITNPDKPPHDRGYGASQATEARAQTELLRDIFGNPLRPATFSPEWRTDTAVALAQQMYGRRDFSALPILADALQDAGCDSDDVLDHCRGGGPHTRGCWVIDVVAGMA